MTDDDRWVVNLDGYIHPGTDTDFASAMSFLLPYKNKIVDGFDGSIRDFIIELVKEIERLQTENIELQSTISRLKKHIEERRVWHSNLIENIYQLKEEIARQKEWLKQRDDTIIDLADRIADAGPANPYEGALMRGCQEGYYGLD